MLSSKQLCNTQLVVANWQVSWSHAISDYKCGHRIAVATHSAQNQSVCTGSRLPGKALPCCKRPFCDASGIGIADGQKFSCLINIIRVRGRDCAVHLAEADRPEQWGVLRSIWICKTNYAASSTCMSGRHTACHKRYTDLVLCFVQAGLDDVYR